MLSKGAILLKAWRISLDLTVNAAAKRFNTDRETYQRWETGGVPHLRYVVAIEDIAAIPHRSWLVAEAIGDAA